MRKYLLLLPMMATLFSACSQGYSWEIISADYVSNRDGILNPNGGEITIKVASTHSFVMTAEPSDACDFVSNGVVNYSQEGVALLELNHLVGVKPNPTNTDRLIVIYAKQRHNPEIQTSLLFNQPAPIKAYSVTNLNEKVDASGGNVVFKIASTNSYVLTSEPYDACIFKADGVVNYAPEEEGVKLIEKEHEVQIKPNTTGQEREIVIYARQGRNPDTMFASIVVKQSAQN